MRTFAKALAALALIAAVSAVRAQDSAPVLQEDPRAARFGDVERGFFVGFEAGWLSFSKTPVTDRALFPSTCPKDPSLPCSGGGASSGLLVGVNTGVDLGSRLALSLFFLGGNERASVDYGAFSVYVAGADARVTLASLSDRNGIERMHVYVHGRGGYARTFPAGLFGDREKYFAGGPGIEYFTRLRHFSLGLAGDLAYAVTAKSYGFAVYPTVRYTF